MTNEQAVKFMKECALQAYKGRMPEKNTTEVAYNGDFPLTELETVEQVCGCIDFVSEEYKNRITPGCAEDVGYFLYVDPCNCSHPINIFATVYTLMLSDADIYVVYDASFHYNDYSETDEFFLDEFVRKYDKAQKVDIPGTLTGLEHIAIDSFISKLSQIKHFIQIGDFCNFGNIKMLKLLKKLNMRVHLPSACYAVLNYKNEAVSDEQKRVLESFGEKCWTSLIDYAVYENESNKHRGSYGFDILDLFDDDLSMFRMLNEIRPLADKVTTIMFTDKTKDEIGYPEEFYECCDVHFSEEFDPEKLMYDFTQLLK